VTERAKTTGGPAFPGNHSYIDGMAASFEGMTHRDYAAIHADQPGIAEIVSMAGLTHSAGQVWSDGQTSLGPFESWWRSIPNSERFMLSARVRYAMADALLAVKAETDPKFDSDGDMPF